MQCNNAKTKVEYFNKHPEEIDKFLNEIFANYALEGDSTALLSALRVMGYQLMPKRLKVTGGKLL